MADLAAMREARKRKILENSENRMRKLLGQTEEKKTENKNDDQKPSNIPDIWNSSNEAKENGERHEDDVARDIHEDNTPDLLKTLEGDKKDVSSKRTTLDAGDQTRNELRSRVSPRRALRENNAASSAATTTTMTTETIHVNKSEFQRTLVQQFELLRITCCLLLALISRWLLSYGIGLFILQSIILPFVALELFIYIYLRSTVVAALQVRSSLMSTALVLCGIKPDVITTYNRIMCYVAAIGEDFAFYMFSFIVVDRIMT